MKVFKIIVSLFLVCTMLTGCGARQNLKDLVIVEGMAVDKFQEDNNRVDNDDKKITLSVQTLNVGMSSGVEKPEGNMTVNSSADGVTIIDAVSNMSNSMSKHMFFGQNKIIMFGREVCESDFKDRVDYFFRSNDARADVVICMVDGKASKLLESTENDAHIPVEAIVNLIYTGEDIGKSLYVMTEDLLNIYTDKTTDMALPVLKLNDKSKTAELNGIAIFSNDRLAKILDDEETLGFLLITGKIKNCLIEFENEKFGRIGIEITSEHCTKNVKVRDGRIDFNIELCGKLLINEIEDGITTKINTEDMDIIREQAERELVRLCNKAFDTCKNYGSDSLRVGEYLAKDSFEDYRLMSDEWDRYFKTVNLIADVRLKHKKISDNTQLD